MVFRVPHRTFGLVYQGLQKYPYCLSSKASFTKTYIKMGIRGSLQILITTTKEEKTGN